MDYTLVEGKTERLVEICKQAGAETYLSGPRARAYIEPERFRDAGVQLVVLSTMLGIRSIRSSSRHSIIASACST